MTETKHSPLPWKRACFQITSAKGDRVCHTGMGNLPPHRSNESEANAAFIELAVNSHDDLQATISRLTEALQTIADGDEPRPLGKRYRSDGEPSKHDKCTHGQWMWEDCGSCVSEFARAFLATPAHSDADARGGQ